jgi:uncharacterized membrane protein
MFEAIVQFIINFPPIIAVALLTIIPFLELRASIPIGIWALKMNWWEVFLIAVIANIIIAPIAYWIFKEAIHIFRKIKFVDKLYHKTIEKVQKKTHKFIEKYGPLGLALFIGVPLPGSGVYSGSVAAVVFDLDFKKFMIASIIGVLIAAIAVTLIVLTGSSAMSFFVKTI